jgi:N-dimethylarginine dimethylaminohydrolase
MESLPGGHTEFGRISRMILKRPEDAFVSDLTVARHWRELGYLSRPDYRRAADEYDELVDLLEGFDIDLIFLSRDDAVGLDSIYVRDAAIWAGDGLILCNMGKGARRTEPKALERAVAAAGIASRGAITDDGNLEGGDVVWIDERTVAVGRGYRTNDEGIRQLRDLLGDTIDELVVVPLPHNRGPDDVFHLMSILSPIDRDLALVYSPLMPVPFREWLLGRGIELIETPGPEFHSLGCNVLTVAPRRCLMLSGNPVARQRLEEAGAEVTEFRGSEICLKGRGGPTCLTRPLGRS